MSWARSKHQWLRDFDAEDLAAARDAVEDYGFWHYVDSQANGYSHPGDCEEKWSVRGRRIDCPDWSHVRGEDSCMAANSRLAQCANYALPGVPFCAFHFDRAWEAMCAFVVEDRIHQITRRAEWAVERAKEDAEAAARKALGDAAFDAAAIRDARNALARQGERVYFFAAGYAVKIGRSVNPEKRVKTLGGTLAPDDIDVRAGKLLGTIPGGSAIEHHLHTRFTRHRLTGEWFRLEPIRDDIETVIREAEREAPPLKDTA